MIEVREVGPTSVPGKVRLAGGEVVDLPAGWACLPPGDAGLTRRLKSLGTHWTVIERRGRKKFSRGVWAPAALVEAARRQIEEERSTGAYARRRAGDARRREAAQGEYVEEFRRAVLEVLAFAPEFAALGAQVAEAVTLHATPVGSGTVARTERIPVQRRAEAAVIAWLRHQTTGYDRLRIARVRGERRRVRGQLAAESRRLLEQHRRAAGHPGAGCPLCGAFARADGGMVPARTTI